MGIATLVSDLILVLESKNCYPGLDKLKNNLILGFNKHKFYLNMNQLEEENSNISLWHLYILNPTSISYFYREIYEKKTCEFYLTAI